MKILGISGSPRVNGNTAFTVKYALKICEANKCKTRYISLADKEIAPCDGCWACEETHKCVNDDDMLEIIESMRWCDALIIGSPVYFGLISGQLKTMMDRTIVMRPTYDDSMEMQGKIGGGIACAAFRNGGQEITLQNIHTYMMQQGMRVVNDGPSYSHSGGTIVKDAEEDELGLKTVSNLANHIISALNLNTARRIS